ncbi:FAD-dependent oxidoreductase [Cupriavidus basilensis]
MTPASAAPLPSNCDLLVIGSGAGGLSAAVVAARLGLKVLVVEKEPVYGGTTAWSGGWMWIPRNPLAVAANITEELEQPLAYLRHELGAQFDEGRARAFLENGPRMVEFFRRHTALEFVDGNTVPDFHGNTPGAATGGRSVCAAPFDARQLGGRIAQLKPPLAETTLWGMGIAGTELRHFLNASRSAKSFCYVARRVMRHWRDLLLHGRGMWLVNGNALVARLAASAFDAGVELRVSCPARRLLEAGRPGGWRGREHPTGEIEIHAARGVVLACGGFPHDVKRKRELLPHTFTGEQHWSAASLGNTGDGLTLGESAGGTIARDLESAAALAPVSLVPRRDGTVAHFPHLIERAKPGLIAVVRNGRRFTNEADSITISCAACSRPRRQGQLAEAWLICDHRFIRRYGLGAVKPAPMPMRASLRSGYLKCERSLAALAQACGIDADTLQRTVQRYNLHARSGADPDFGKGETPYNRVQGDASLDGPNPCMAPIEHGPFYAVRIVAGSLGTFAGLVTNASAQVLDARRQPIPGLYAGGNDMSSVMGGNYPSGGITLGPAMTFGFVAACHAAGRDPARVA